MAQSDKGTEARPDTNRGHERRPQAGARAGRPSGDGRHNSEQLRRNQQTLGVGGDHRTDTMKKHRRGTFP